MAQTRVGADVPGLRTLSSTFQSQSQDLERLVQQVSRQLEQTHWEGDKAQRFRQEWEEAKKVFSNMRNLMDESRQDINQRIELFEAANR
jgi:WXG100 family type VII secretion target